MSRWPSALRQERGRILSNDKRIKHIAGVTWLVGTLEVMATALRFKKDTLRHALDGKENVSPTMAFRVARLAAVGIDDLLAGKWPVKGTCPHCGRGPG